MKNIYKFVDMCSVTKVAEAFVFIYLKPEKGNLVRLHSAFINYNNRLFLFQKSWILPLGNTIMEESHNESARWRLPYLMRIFSHRL